MPKKIWSPATTSMRNSLRVSALTSSTLSSPILIHSSFMPAFIASSMARIDVFRVDSRSRFTTASKEMLFASEPLSTVGDVPHQSAAAYDGLDRATPGQCAASTSTRRFATKLKSDHKLENAPNNGAAENCSGAAARVTLAAPRRPAAQPARHAPPPLRGL